MATFVNMMDLVYPIGSIYQSMSPTNPGAIFLGQWTQITSKFLYAANSSNVIGGSSLHKHTYGWQYAAYYGGLGTCDNTQVDRVLSPANKAVKYNEGSCNEDGTNITWMSAKSPWGHNFQYAYQNSVKIIETPDILTAIGETGKASTLPPYTTCYTWYRTS